MWWGGRWKEGEETTEKPSVLDTVLPESSLTVGNAGGPGMARCRRCRQPRVACRRPRNRGSGRHLKAGLAFGCPLPGSGEGLRAVGSGGRRAEPAARIFRMKLSARHGSEMSEVLSPGWRARRAAPEAAPGKDGVPASPTRRTRRGGQPGGRLGPRQPLACPDRQGCLRTAGRAQLPRSPGLPTTGKRPGSGAERSGAVAREDGLAEEMGYFLLVFFAAFFFKLEPHAPLADR